MRLIDADGLKEKSWDADTRIGYVQVVDVGDIDDAPTIDPYKHGKWVSVDGMKYVYCSACGSEDETEDSYFVHYAYCPRCGAKMDLR